MNCHPNNQHPNIQYVYNTLTGNVHLIIDLCVQIYDHIVTD